MENSLRNVYVVSSDGKRFLMNVPTDKATASFIVVLNWTALLNR
jgi:hypothetical protein